MENFRDGCENAGVMDNFLVVGGGNMARAMIKGAMLNTDKRLFIWCLLDFHCLLFQLTSKKAKFTYVFGQSQVLKHGRFVIVLFIIHFLLYFTYICFILVNTF